MKMVGRYIRLVCFRLISILRVVVLCVLALLVFYRVPLLLEKGLATADWFSPSMIGEYAIIIVSVIGFVFLIAIKNEIKTRLEIVQTEIEFTQSIRREKMAEKQLMEMLGHQSSTLSSRENDGEEISTREFVVQKTSKDPKGELAALIGIEAVKKQIEKLEAKLSYEKILKGNREKTSLHTRFVGGPGTGKTTVGRIMAGLLYQTKQIPKDKYVEINGNDLVGQYVGQTPLVVKEAFRAAAGGVLFIDEVYALVGGGYSGEVVTQLLTLLENNTDGTVVIMAGYREEMECFFAMNPGLPSRVPNIVEFPDYSPLELLEIAERMLKKFGHTISRDAVQKVFDIIRMKIKCCAVEQKPFGNARYVRNIVEELHQEHALNYQRNVVSDHVICLADIDEDALMKLD